MNLDLVEARWRVGYIRASELPGLASELVAAGHGVPTLAQLADGVDRPPARKRQMFELALRELGRGTMTGSDGARLVARSFAEGLLEGELTPRATARAIARVRWKGGPDVDAELCPFEELDERYEAIERSRLRPGFLTAFVDRRVRARARALVGS